MCSSLNAIQATVTFKNHPTYVPVVWLVQGNVSIAGTLRLSGQNGTGNVVEALTPPEPPPGDFAEVRLVRRETVGVTG